MKLATSAVFGLLVFVVGNVAADEINFHPAADFAKLPDEMALGACSAVAVNSNGEIHLLHRGEHPVIVVDPAGKYLRSWGDDDIHTGHGLRIDRDDHVWVTDTETHQVLKFTPTGKLLMAWGKAGQAGVGTDEFDKPTDVAFGPNGEVYVADGYGNTRIIQFTPNGGFLTQWGKAGSEPEQFNTPHSIVVDVDGRVIVGDRENDRIQIFDAAGKLQEVWPGFAPYGLALDQQGHLFVADGRAHKVLQLDDHGKIVASWGESGSEPGQFNLPHMLAADSDGNLYIAEVKNKRFQKLARR